jgi:hypothetical protein
MRTIKWRNLNMKCAPNVEGLLIAEMINALSAVNPRQNEKNGGMNMPTWVNAHPWVAESVKNAGGQLVRIGSKPWAHFNGADAAERARAVEEVYEKVHGHKCYGLRPWRADQKFDYAIRLD